MIKSVSVLKRVLVGFICTATLMVSFFGATNSASARAGYQTGTTRYVASSGTDSGNCTSPASPCRTIQYAVNQSSSGGRILVAQGTYTYNAGVDPCTFLTTPNEKSVVCIVDKFLSIFGGYSTSNWSTANPSANPTVIDGQGNYRGVFLLGYQTTTVSLDMEGFTIQNGRSAGQQGGADPNGFGGGMGVFGARVTLRDMVFKNNKVYGLTGSTGGAGAGAGLAINWSQPGTSNLLERVAFDGNQSFGANGTDRGGVAYGALFVNGSVTITSCTFTNNQALAGNSSGSGGVNGGQHADALGGAIGGGGGIWVLGHIVATNNQAIGGNATTYAGGGFGGGIFVEEASSLTITDSTLSGNTAKAGNAVNGGFGAGGGLLVNNTPATIDRVQLIANSAIGGNAQTGSGSAGTGGGGGLYLWKTKNVSANASVLNTIIANNFVNIGSVGNASQGGGGGGVQVQGLTATLSHTTIAQNRLGPALVLGQGLLVLTAPGVSSSTANLNYSIVANHTEGGSGATAIFVDSGNTINFNRGLFAGNTLDKTILGSQSGQGSMFSAASAGFVSPGSPNFDYHLQSNSPAKDQATGSSTDVDIDGQFRPFNNISDLGADEYWTVVLDKVTTGVFRPTNGALYLKNNNMTGFADVQINYGLGGDYPVVGDWDGNGTVTIGVYRNGSFYLRNSNSIGFADSVFPFGQAGDQPIAGDWNGDGRDTIGVYRNGTFFLRNSNSPGTPDATFQLGNPGDVAIAGDWTGKGYDTTGVFRPSNGALYLKNLNTSGFADIQINYGLAGDKPVVGDWDGNGTVTIGVYRGNQFLLRNSNTIGFAEIVFSLGNAGDMPIAGDWDALP